MKIKYLDLATTDAAFNLAAEQYVFDALPRDSMYVMLWQNRRAVIIGKHQNTQAEINAAYVRERQIQVVRRLSGGGAVYHDMGNLNFSFIADAGRMGTLDLKLFCRPVIDTLRDFGVSAELNGRNDMTIEGRKFSGNAQYMKQGRVMHHGTILFDSDLGAVTQALNADETKIRSKGIASVRSRVTNIRPYLPENVTLPLFRQSLLTHILEENPGEAYAFSEADLRGIEEIKTQRYSRWDWNFGLSPACTAERKRRIEGCGTVTAFLSADKGFIRALSFRGDFFSTLEPELLAQKLIGKRLNAEELRLALKGEDLGLYFLGMTEDALIGLLLG